jgi:formate hydrogenlyase subunit 6/NADH:ubiquinone oxidoreductase subunit I
MKLSRFFKTIFMTDFVGGLLIATKELFKPKKTINYPLKKVKLAHVLEVNMHSEDIQMERKDV